MGLGRQLDIFNEHVFDRVRPTVFAAADATVSVFDPDIQANVDVNYATGDVEVTRGASSVASAAARIMPVRGANLRDGDPIQRVRIAINAADIIAPIRSGFRVHVEAAPLSPTLVGQYLDVVEIMQSSAPLTFTFEAMLNTHMEV